MKRNLQQNAELVELRHNERILTVHDMPLDFSSNIFHICMKIFSEIFIIAFTVNWNKSHIFTTIYEEA